jgi:hypothetical protein
MVQRPFDAMNAAAVSPGCKYVASNGRYSNTGIACPLMPYIVAISSCHLVSKETERQTDKQTTPR